MEQFLRFLDARVHPEMSVFLVQTVLRLVLAAVLGGLIGLERETKRKPAGLRTNMFICFGAAMFTILSDRLAGDHMGDHTRIAAQIIPGIGFIGAGSILHSRGNVTGLTTAATLFVVASIGMAAGGGLFLAAIFGTIVLLVALVFLGILEERYHLKPHLNAFVVIGDSIQSMIDQVSSTLDDMDKSMQRVEIAKMEELYKLRFVVDATKTEDARLLKLLRELPSIRTVEDVGEVD
jgi:putative Mg2+ transporter-C (MgtC) family protein